MGWGKGKAAPTKEFSKRFGRGVNGDPRAYNRETEYASKKQKKGTKGWGGKKKREHGAKGMYESVTSSRRKSVGAQPKNKAKMNGGGGTVVVFWGNREEGDFSLEIEQRTIYSKIKHEKNCRKRKK